MDRLSVENTTDSMEDMHQEIILKYFELSGRDNDVFGIENMPKIVEAGFIAICLKGECELMIDHGVYKFKSCQICVGLTATVVEKSLHS